MEVYDHTRGIEQSGGVLKVVHSMLDAGEDARKHAAHEQLIRTNFFLVAWDSRVMIAMALLCQPKLWFADEPHKR